MDIRRAIAILESSDDDRVMLAYCKKHDIKISDLSQEELDRCYQEALAGRDSYPIPTTSSEYVYHGTRKTNLPSIARHGLVPSEKTVTHNPSLTGHALGKVFFASTVDNAEFYSLRGAGRKPRSLLRVRRSDLPDLLPDAMDDTSYFVDRAVAPNLIEVWTDSGWRSIST